MLGWLLLLLLEVLYFVIFIPIVSRADKKYWEEYWKDVESGYIVRIEDPEGDKVDSIIAAFGTGAAVMLLVDVAFLAAGVTPFGL